MLKKIGVIFLSAMLLSACGNQDPFEGKSDNIKNAVPPDQKPIKGGHGTDDFVLTPPGDLDFEEGVQKSIQLTVRMVGEQLPFQISILDAPVNSTFDATQNIFTWTPSLGTVGKQASVVYPVRFLASTTDGSNLVSEKLLNIRVVRNLKVKPTIERLDRLPAYMEEGERQYFYIYVRDTYSNGTSAPVLAAYNAGDVDLSAYLKNDTAPDQDSNDPTLWKFSVSLDLRNAELTDSSSFIPFSFYAISGANGALSAVKSQNIHVATVLAAPLISWSDADIIEFKSNQKNVFNFVIAAPVNVSGRAEGRFQNVNFQNACAALPGTAKCRCDVSPTNKLANCTVDYTPNVTEVKTFNFSIAGELVSNGQKVRPQKFLFDRTIKVMP